MEIALVSYEGSLRNKAIHLNSGETVFTDAPLDNHGLAAYFSPTDMVATSLATCMFTIMGIAAQERGWQIEGSSAKVSKTMGSKPRRIVEIGIRIQLPAALTADQRVVLERAALNCPVAKSLSEEIVQNVSFEYSL